MAPALNTSKLTFIGLVIGSALIAAAIYLGLSYKDREIRSSCERMHADNPKYVDECFLRMQLNRRP